MKQVTIVLMALLVLTGSLRGDAAEARTKGDVVQQPPPPLEELLDGLLLCFLTDTNSFATHSTDFYGTLDDKEIVLVNSAGGIPWPKDYGTKELGGWKLIPEWKLSDKELAALRKGQRKIGVRIDLLCINAAILDSKRGEPFFGPITLCIFNAGGNPDKVVHIGGAFFYFSAEAKDGKWLIKSRGGFDP